MIIGIGCDIVSHTLTAQLNWHNDTRIRSRIFSGNEMEQLPSQVKLQIAFLSARFAAKEAVLKCLSTGIIDGVSLLDIEILAEKGSMPTIRLSGYVLEMSLLKEITNWHLSLSHDDTFSIAFVVAEN
jgi:holo-[acyl-carrier protein] synthase